MLRNFYLVLILTLPFSICYDYDTDHEEHYQPKMNKKVRGRRKQYNDEEVHEFDSRGFEGYSDDKESMAQLDLMSFLKKPSASSFDSLPESNKMGYPFYKKKRGVLSNNFHLRRSYVNKMKSSKEVPQFVSIYKVNSKPYENLNNFDESTVQSKNSFALSDIAYKDDIDVNSNLNTLNSYENNNAQGRTAVNKYSKSDFNWTYQQKKLKSNQYPDQYIDNREKLRQNTPSNNVNIKSDLVYKKNKIKSKNIGSPKRYKLNSLVFDGTTKQKNALSKDIDYGSVLKNIKNENPKYGKSLNNKQKHHDSKKYEHYQTSNKMA